MVHRKKTEAGKRNSYVVAIEEPPKYAIKRACGKINTLLWKRNMLEQNI